MAADEPPPGRGFEIVNLESATFECTFGRGCEGVCCRNGRPPVYYDESLRIADIWARVFPLLREEARKRIEKFGFLTSRRKFGAPMARMAKGWCVFFNRGCVLHRVGAEDGDKYRYKPMHCALFPISRSRDGRWQVRQRNNPQEKWKDLFCLDPKVSAIPASMSLADETALARRLDREAHRQSDI